MEPVATAIHQGQSGGSMPVANPQIVSSLDDVAAAFVVKGHGSSNGGTGCSELQNVYDLDAIRDWRDQRAKVANDPLLRQKLEAEVRKLEAESKGEEAKQAFLSRDKSFWLAVLAMGIPVGEKLAAWLKSEFAGKEHADKDVAPQTGWFFIEGFEVKKIEEMLKRPAEFKRFLESLRDTKGAKRVLIVAKEGLPISAVVGTTKHDFRIRRVSLKDARLREIIEECRREGNPLVLTDDGKDLLAVRPDEFVIDLKGDD